MKRRRKPPTVRGPISLRWGYRVYMPENVRYRYRRKLPVAYVVLVDSPKPKPQP